MTPAERAARRKPAKPTPGPRGAGKLPNRLKELRDALGLSLRDVERETGVKNPTVYTAECGCNVNLETALRLARFYGMSVEEIWNEPK